MILPEIITNKQAAEMIPAGARIMIGGFMGCGNPHGILAELAELMTRELTVIANDASKPDGPDGSGYYGIAKLIHNKQVKKLIASHVGSNPEVAQQLNDGTLEVELIPQGSLAEMIRAGGMGLGGILTPTGLGTVVEEAGHVHSVVDVDGRKFLLERPVRADYALIGAHTADRAGNLWYKGTTRNFCEVMAMAADTVLAEVERVVEIGEIVPENVVTPGILVDYLCRGNK
ncbi:MAG: CoA transferase subunit A [Synergistaceae bacterium]|nr:CoA transferase subunit A [Synergistaceae bacterium]